MNVIFFDIDGTLATRTFIPESAKEAIRTLRAKGDKVFICSGRYRAYAEKHFSPYADGFICNNGRLAFIGDEYIVQNNLTEAQIRDIISRIDPTGVSYVFFEEQTAHFCGTDELFKEVMHGSDTDAFDRVIDPASMNVYNFDIFYTEYETFEKAKTAIDDICICNLHTPHKSADITILGTDKGDAVKSVIEYLGVKPENSYAFGDGTNDVSMLKAVGHGIAMGNAQPELKEIAEYITTSIDDDGVKNGLLHYGLI